MTTIDCRRAQFSAQEPIIRLRMICQSWKVMFQAEYSSGSPLRMLVDLRASVEHALGRGKAAEAGAKAKPGTAANLSAGKLAPAAKPAPLAAKAAAAAGGPVNPKAVTPAAAPAAARPRPAGAPSKAPEFEVSGTPGWDPDAPQAPRKK